jgi:E3 ubiquitin-protein ligase DOA10
MEEIPIKHCDCAMADNEKSERKEKEQQQHQDMELVSWRKKIEIIGIDIKGLERENETERLKLRTAFMNQHFINELDRIGLQLIKITSGTIFTRGFIVFLEPKLQSNRMLTE